MKLLLAGVLLLSSVFAVNAQDEAIAVNPSISMPAEPSPEIREMKEDMEMLGLYSFKYDLNAINGYDILLVVDEYKEGKLVKELFDFESGTAYPVWEGEEIAGWEDIASIRIVFNHSDSKRLKVMFDFPKVAIATKYWDTEHMNRYQFRQFKLPETWQPGKKVPLIAYSSMYYDEKAGIYRFCGSKFPKDLEDELFKLSPHYYVVSITFVKAKKE